MVGAAGRGGRGGEGERREIEGALWYVCGAGRGADSISRLLVGSAD